MPWPRRSLAIHVALYGAALAGLSLLLAWLDFRRVAHGWSASFAVLMLAIGFVALGIWVGNRLAARGNVVPFTRNHAAIRELGISPRELEVLDNLAQGAPNKVIARRLAISPNTVKTHVARLLEKLDAANRTQAIARARDLRLVP